ncbi:hypothetical protein BMF89_16495 [Arthrobacter sp. SRS-W-1-2016]|uniref:restriction endonuclease subunit S n=1 Tax=Arthrobacter sp. SRS-W-1-2016 TaxID=1930254 RepID=UPI000990F9ED|nr:restriction endonuclease subunit S [Arthrobacter sp. SRS-W-1-2016]OOP60469.1 hypothetical protein BMF89_16495 [Arthrobacter sp. SRS-W-1-2016]
MVDEVLEKRPTIDWKKLCLRDVATFASGTTPSRARQSEYFDGGTFPWVKTMDLNNSKVFATDECVTELAFRETSLKLNPSGSVLVAMYGGFQQIGRTGILTMNAAVNQAISVINPDPKYLSPSFLLYVLNFRIDYWKTVASSSRKDPNITSQDVRNFVLLVPHISEQKAIVEVLDDINAVISSLEALLAKKQAIKKGMMQMLLTGQTRLPGFSGDWTSLHVASNSTLKARIGWQGLTTDEYRSDGECRLVGGTEFSDGRVDWSRTPFVDRWRYDQDSGIQLRQGDVLLTKDGTIGKTAFVDELPGPCTLNSGVFVIRPTRKAYNSHFLYYMLRSKRFDEFLSRLTAGSTISHLYQRDLVGLLLDVPPTLEEQGAIAKTLYGADAELRALRGRLSKAQSLKQGMMQELLTGRLRLQSVEATS